MEIHGEIGAIVSGDVFGPSPLPFVETDTQPPRAPIGSEGYKSRSLSSRR
jgi:hypothetical protein